MKRQILHVILLALACSRPLWAGQALIGTRPFSDSPIRVSLDLFPLALGYFKGDDIAYWHGLSTGVAVERDIRLVSLGYGVAFFGLNSGGVFVGPLIDVDERAVGFTLDITYCIFSAPLKLSLQRIRTIDSRDMFFAVGLSAGIGALFPLVRVEKGKLRPVFDR
jgi:hypothetical protein